MIKSLTQVVALFTFLLPLAVNQASAGTFTFKVTDRQSSKAVGASFFPKVAFPESLPKFRKGQSIKFTLTADGKLSGPGFAMPIYTDGPDYDTYSKPPTASNPKPHVFIVYKSKGKPDYVELYFYKSKVVDGVQVVNTVYYKVE